VTAAAPDWASIMTAFGTVAVAIVAAGVAVWLEPRRTNAAQTRADQQLAEERARHDKETAEERALAAERLALQLAHSDAQLADERRHSAAQLQAERQLAQDREQLAEAYAVQVSGAARRWQDGELPVTTFSGLVDDDSGLEFSPVAIVVNHSDYVITQIDARFCLSDSTMIDAREADWAGTPLEGFAAELTIGLEPLAPLPREHVLTPTEPGVRFEGDPVRPSLVASAYPLVRWTDRWGTRWEHRKGKVRQVTEGEDWKA
jgi:hypothetical protein